MHVAMCIGYALTIPFSIGLFQFKYRLYGSGGHNCTHCFPCGILPLQSQWYGSDFNLCNLRHLQQNGPNFRNFEACNIGFANDLRTKNSHIDSYFPQ